MKYTAGLSATIGLYTTGTREKDRNTARERSLKMTKVMPCEVYSRVVGYYRPVHNWNAGKRKEYEERVEFSSEKSLEKMPIQTMPLVGGGSETIDSYKLFTFPNCSKCMEVKEFLSTQELTGSVVNLKETEGNKIFREYYRVLKDKIKRDDDGAVKLPVLLLMNGEDVLHTAQGIEETKQILC